MKKLLLILCCLPLLMVAQTEKRLALVIGNSNYDKGALKNPVRDALLIAKTLEELQFDVILDTNLSNRSALNSSIKEFGQRRGNYDVGFVYYAGHGIQIKSINYLLPTKVDFESEFDVEDNAVSVQNIMRYLTSATDQVNVLILDACRDNPYEGGWNKTRSLKGNGLAKMKAPTGSLIAFSTTAGSTAPDGDGVNSVYCTSLVKNMRREGISLDQVFRNVRAEVLKLTNGVQQTEESTQLTGETFYLVKSSFEKEFALIDSLGNEGLFYEALEIASSILQEDPKNLEALLVKGEVYEELEEFDKAIKDYNLAISFYPNNPKPFRYKGWLLSNKFKDYHQAIDVLNISLEIDSTYIYSYNDRAAAYLALEDYDNALSDYTKAIELDSDNPDRYADRADCYIEMEDYTNALKDYDKSIVLAPEEKKYYVDKANIFYYQGDIKLFVDEYSKVIDLHPDYSHAYSNRAIGHENLGEYEKALSDYSKAIDIDGHDLKDFSNRADLYLELEDYEKALTDLTKAIELDKNNYERYSNRADCYIEMEDYTSALKDYDKAVELDVSGTIALNARGLFYYDRGEYDLALKDFELILKVDPAITYAINNRALIFSEQGDHELAIKEYTKAIEITPDDPLYYENRAGKYFYNLKDYEKALADLTKAIELDKNNYDRYINRADCYLEMEDYTSALKDYDKAIDLAPEDTESYNVRGLFYYNQGEYDLALADFEFVLKLDPNYTSAINNRALIYGEQGKPELEIETYTQAIAINPDDPLYYSNRAIIYASLEDYEKALADLTKTIELDKKNPERYTYRANCYVAMEDYTNALKDFTRAIDLDSESSYIFQSRANFYSEQEEYDLALKDLEKALKLDPNDWEVHYDIASIYEDQGKPELEIEAFTKAILVAEDSIALGLIYGARSLAYQLQGVVDKAEKDIEQSLKYNPEDQLAPLSLLVLYLYNEKYHVADSLCNAQIPIKREFSFVSLFYAFKGLIAYRLDKHDDVFLHLNTSLETNDAMSEEAWEVANSMLSKIYMTSKKYKEAKDICKKEIEDKENIDAYYDLALIYSIEDDPYESIMNLNEVIELIASGNDPPAKEDWLTANYLDISGETSLAEIHLKRGEQWNKLDKKERACKDFQKACDLGDCEMFNKNCK